MSNTDLSTKFRPRTLDEVLGQGHIVKSFAKAIANGSTHAFILTGPSGCGKTTMARIGAEMVKCKKSNIIEVDAASKTGIGDMRDLCAPLAYSSLGGGPKVLIIDEAHALSKAAWQSLLKSIEEPPPNVYWFLCTTESDKIPATIRTRCAAFNVKPVHSDMLFTHLQDVCKREKIKVPEDVLDLISRQSDGSPRQALVNLAACMACEDRQEAAQVLQRGGQSKEAVDLCRLLMKGCTFAEAMQIMPVLEGQDGESIRRMVLAYFTPVAIKSPAKAKHVLSIIGHFAEPYPPNSGLTYVVLSLGNLLL